MGAGVIGNELRIDPVGFVALAFALGVVLDPAWVDDTDRVASLKKKGSGQITVASGGLEYGSYRAAGELPCPGKELADAFGSVGKTAAVRALPAQKTGLKAGLGDIQAEVASHRLA